MILIIIKFDMFEISRTALLSELILLIRLKFLSHSAVLTGNVFIQFMSGFRFWAHYWALSVGPASHSVLGLCTS